MRYSTPELTLLGSAPALVLGDAEGEFDNVPSETQPTFGVPLGLDD
jgi:hypothetical protein